MSSCVVNHENFFGIYIPSTLENEAPTISFKKSLRMRSKSSSSNCLSRRGNSWAEINSISSSSSFAAASAALECEIMVSDTLNVN